MLRTRLILPLIAVVLLFIGCADRPDLFGVLLWSVDESRFQTGTVVPIYATSQLNATYSLKDLDNESVSIEQWRISAVRREGDAEELAAEFEPFSELYGVAELDGLNIRETADAEANRLYKLRLGEVVKIVGRSAESSTVGEYEGYWYSVLTADGVMGFTFSVYLEIKSFAELAGGGEIESVDEFLEQFFSTIYRPDYYREMSWNRRFDLERFLPEYGIYPDRENQRIVIVTEEHESIIEYDAISKPTSDSYAFDGTPLIVNLVKTWINLIYSETIDGKIIAYSEDYVYFPDDIEMITSREQDRRVALFEEMLLGGSRLESAAYGSIELAEGGTFIWSGYERLVPDVVPEETSGRGFFTFPLYLDSAVAPRYSGAVLLTFVDETATPVGSSPFLYTYDSAGLRLTYVTDAELEENLVKESSVSSIILFFEYR